MLDAEQSFARAKRIAKLLAQRNLDALVCGQPRHVYYFTAYLPRWTHHAAAVIFADGSTCLIKPDKTPAPAGMRGEAIDYAADFLYTLRQEQPQTVGASAVELLKKRGAKRVGIDTSSVNAQLSRTFEGHIESLDADLWQMRRRKDPDELALMNKAIRCAEAMFRRAREIIEPGISELEVFGQLHTAAVVESGEPLSAMLGNDYACGCMGGPPREGRRAQAGEIYILDVGPAYRGYFSDVTRAFAVDRRETDAQHRAWETLVGVHESIQKTARPGVRGADLYKMAEEHLKQSHGVGHAHHLGHGVGLQPHEYPHLNPHWDDVLMEGEVFTVEPGIYSDELAGGIRLENQYLVTANGLQNLVNFDLDL